MTYAIGALLAGIALYLIGCGSQDQLSQQMLNEIVQKNGEVVTLTAVSGGLGVAMVLLSAGLAALILLRRRGGGNDD